MKNAFWYSKNRLFLLACFCFLCGVVIASIGNIRVHGMVPIYLSLFFFSIAGKDIRLRMMVIIVGCVYVGVWRYSIAFPHSQNHISTDYGKTVKLQGVVSAEPDIRQDGVRYIVQVASTTSGESRTGNVYISHQLYPRYEYGDHVQITCKIKEPEPVEDFRYDMFLARYRVFALCQNAQIEKVAGLGGNKLLRYIFTVKSWVAQQVNVMWHEPYAGFMAGLLYGYRGGLGSLNELFAITGVTHIIAISGYNITLIATILLRILQALHIKRTHAFWLIIMGIGIFVIFAGASASVVRAGIMGVLVLWAQFMGRKSHIVTVLVLSAVIMTIHNPFILFWDAGFQLSFLSTLGLLYISPLIAPYISWVPKTFELQESFSATLAATLATLPLIVTQFGRLSVVSIMVNMLILWALPLIMGFGFFAVMAHKIAPIIAYPLAWIAWSGMKYIVVIVSWFAQLPFAAVEIILPGWIAPLGYCMMGTVVWYQYKKRQTYVT